METRELKPVTDYLSSYLMGQSVGNRHGVVLEPEQAPLSRSDIDTIIHLGVPRSVSSPWQSAAGGVGREEITARLAAIGEGIERASSALADFPLKKRSEIEHLGYIDAEEFALFTAQQRAESGFPFGNIYRADCPYGEVFSLQDNQAVWVPQPFITLQDNYQTGVPTSSGLAAGSSPKQALLRGIQELIERDALMTTWLHGLAGRAIEPPKKYLDEVAKLAGDMTVFDLTPNYSPFPVMAVIGGIKKQGRWRYSLGVACRETWQEAVEKAYLEWNQGILFAGIYGQFVDTSTIQDPYKLASFDEHAIYYSLFPEQWHQLPIFENRYKIHQPPKSAITTNLDQSLELVKQSLKKHDIRLFYRDISTIDAWQSGVHVVKALSPDMTMIFSHQEWPFLDKVDGFLEKRYKKMRGVSKFPFLMPHPLG